MDTWIATCQRGNSSDSKTVDKLSFPIREQNPDSFAPIKIKLWHAWWVSQDPASRTNAPVSGWWDLYSIETLQVKVGAFDTWFQAPEIRQQLQKNVHHALACVSNQTVSLKTMDWYRMLQSCFDFALMTDFALVWEQVTKQWLTWSPQERACLVQIF